MSETVVVKPVATRRERRRFQRFAWSVYSGDRNWVPPILAQERELLGWGIHPFFDHARCVALLAERGGRVAGRLAVLVNDVHNDKYNEKRGFFGFFECIDDSTVANALLHAGESWLRDQGMTSIRGPVNPSLNYACGLLVDGFDRPPCFLMTYNPPYYPDLLKSWGFAKSQDLYAYEMDTALLAKVTQRYKPAVLAALQHSNLVVRPMDPKQYQREVETYLDIYNRSLDGTWGFTPLQPSEARHIARDLRHVITPRFAIFAEMDGRPIGALLALLDYNQILRKCNGRLFPLGLLRLLMGRRCITAVRAMGMTMVPGFQQAGLAVVLMDNLIAATEERGIDRYEFSWVLESNARSRGTLERLGIRITSTYRIYDKSL